MSLLTAHIVDPAKGIKYIACEEVPSKKSWIKAFKIHGALEDGRGFEILEGMSGMTILYAAEYSNAERSAIRRSYAKLIKSTA